MGDETTNARAAIAEALVTEIYRRIPGQPDEAKLTMGLELIIQGSGGDAIGDFVDACRRIPGAYDQLMRKIGQ